MLLRRRRKEKTKSQMQNRLRKNHQKNKNLRNRMVPKKVRTNHLLTGQKKHVNFSLSLEEIPNLRDGLWLWQRLQAFTIL